MSIDQYLRRSNRLAVAFLVCLVLTVFYPVIGFDFINLDALPLVARNSNIQGLDLDSLKYVLSWTTNSYYPVRSLTYAVDRQLWGTYAGGFKATNVFLHLASVLLLFWLILRLLVRQGKVDDGRASWRETVAATCGAGLFAIHPVVVEPVIWVPGREELLMTLAGLAAVHLHFSSRQLEALSAPRWEFLLARVGAVVCCLAACLSNVVAVTIPLIIIGLDRIVLVGNNWPRIFRDTTPFLAVAAFTFLLKKMANADFELEHPEYLSVHRLVVVSKAYALNLKTYLWPTNLTLDYPRIHPDDGWMADVALGAACLTMTVVVFGAARRNRTALAGLAWFLLALAPTAQIMPHHINRADRFLYLPLVGLAIAVAAGLLWIGRRIQSPVAWGTVTVALVALLAGLNYASARQVWIWQDSITLWEWRLRVQPESQLAHQCLGDAFADAGRLPEAIPHYDWVLRRSPDESRTLHNYAMYLALSPESERDDLEKAVQLATKGFRITKGADPKLRRTLALSHMNYGSSLRAEGRLHEAVEQFQAAIDADPTYKKPLFNLALLLAASEIPELRRPEEAVQLAERAASLPPTPELPELSVLASVYAGAGKFDRAVDVLERAIIDARTRGETDWIAGLEAARQEYQRLATSRSDGEP